MTSRVSTAMRFAVSSAAMIGLAAGVAGCRRNPETAKQAYFNAATSYVNQGKLKEGIIEYRNALRIDPNFGLARYRLGQAYARSGDAGNAYAEYIRAADLMPDDSEVQLTAGQFLVMGGQF